jgi:glutamate racemase
LVEEYPNRKILGVIIPMVEEVVECHAKRALLIATRRTIESGKYEREFSKFSNSPELFSIATPTLVPLIEAGRIDEAVMEVMPMVEELILKGGDSLILGCTHYGLLKQGIEECIGTGGHDFFTWSHIQKLKMNCRKVVQEIFFSVRTHATTTK